MKDYPETLLRALFDAAIAAADPMLCVPPHLPKRPDGRLIVVGAGKAAARMAQATEAHLEGPVEGIVVTRYGHGVPCKHIRVLEASHPVPNARGAEATDAILNAISGLTDDDLVLALISGGGSALLVSPAGNISLEEKRDINSALLRCGATISEMNTIRKHLSKVKGGGLATRAHPARVLSLMISDVPGDDPAVIASGPTTGTTTRPEDALRLLESYEIGIPASIREHLQNSDGPPAPSDPRFALVENRIIAAPQLSLEAAADAARIAGITPMILGDGIEGESREIAVMHAGIARQVLRHDQPLPSPCVLISGGETTVTVRGQGCGGRNVEFLLALAIALDGEKRVFAIAGDTDGVDGSEEIAGAVIGPETLPRARTLGLDPIASLSNNDGHSFFEALDDQIVTGPTLTNVNDFRAVMIL